MSATPATRCLADILQGPINCSRTHLQQEGPDPVIQVEVSVPFHRGDQRWKQRL
ncbi:hypothetical protein EV129_12755 [Rhizobium azibense]|uniref:Uncharacterized protein n=1 Tax=Rhizobium azibense TaxID=1136135 RepID=A0A4R3R891_9HYPH|nr:hypothetical protein EV129_12755 [Rhizobium azibense]